MKRLFNIASPETIESKDQLLLCEISYYHICLAAANAATRQLIHLAYFENSQPIAAQDVKRLLDGEGIHPERYQKVVVSSAFPEAILVPEAHFDRDVLKTQWQHPDQDLVFFDRLEAQGIWVAYSMPSRVYHELNSRSPVEVINTHTTSLKTHTEPVANSEISVYFSSREFRVVVKKEEQLQLAQTYAFHSPLDVVYYLLMITQQFQLSQTETAVVLSGLIDENSALYKEIYQYFLKVQFAQPEAHLLPVNDYHQHFFSSIYNLAACVS